MRKSVLFNSHKIVAIHATCAILTKVSGIDHSQVSEESHSNKGRTIIIQSKSLRMWIVYLSVSIRVVPSQ